MHIGITGLHQHQSHWVDPPDNNKLSLSTSNQGLYPCQYNEDLGSDDSDPESQISDSSSSTSQDSGHSPATSYSSEESRADQNQCNNESLYDSWPVGPVSATNPSGSRITCDLPSRPKLEQSLHQKASEHALIAAQQAIRHTATQNNFSNAPASNVPNPRRGRSVVSSSVPALRRDTEPTDSIVRMIVFFCTNLINSIWCTSGQSPTDTAARQGGNVLPLEIFITETLRRSKTSYSTLQIALYYLILLKQCLPVQSAADKSGCRAMQCGRRMFLTSLILASKYLQDRNYSARAWSKISGLPLKEINENERRFLSIVNWDLHVPKSTFENWSKIVLQVCRRSQDITSTGCKSPDSSNNGSRGGPTSAQQCFTSPLNGNNRTWWFVNLRQLKTDVVKCPIKTQSYVESLCLFRPITPISRPISPASDTSDDSLDSLADVLLETPRASRQPSLDRSSKRFEPVPDLLHPAAPVAMPPQPTLKNLPTPLTTPQSNVQNYWTPRLAYQSSSSNLRCRASASALGSAFRRHCPIANLETCPPPPPPYRACDRVQRPYAPADNCYSSSASVVSSPESTTSEVFSAPGRSRSSSISSTASWATNSSHQSDMSWFAVGQPVAPSLACPQQPMASGTPLKMEQAIERPRTAFKVPQVSDSTYESTSWLSGAEPLPGVNSIENIHNDISRSSQREEILAGIQVDESAVRSRARPVLSRSGTQIYNPRQEQDSKIQPLKRSRSDTFEFSSNSSSSCQLRQLACWNQLQELNSFSLRVQQPTQDWAQPRKPLQTGPQNKRLALQSSTSESFAAAEASRSLKSDIVREMSRPGSVVH